MSLVLAVKDKNRVILGSDKQSSIGSTKDHTCTKIWQVPDLPGALMGSVGSARVSQIIQYAYVIDKNAFKTEPTTEFVITALGPTILNALKLNGIDLDPGEGANLPIMPNAFIFAYKDKAWMIWNDLSVTEINDYLAIGSGSDVANGALFATKGKNPFERIITAIDAAADSTLFVDNGVDLLATIPYKDDQRLIEKAFGKDDILKTVLEEIKKVQAEEEKTETKPKSVKKKPKKATPKE